MKENKYFFPEPPPFIFVKEAEKPKDVDTDRAEDNSHAHTARMVLAESNLTYLIDYMDFGEGIKVYYKDLSGNKFPFPKKGFPFPEAVASINRVKRYIMDIVQIASKPQFILSWALILLSSKRKDIIEKLLELFNQFAYPLVGGYLVKPVLMTELASELQGIIHGFLLCFGIQIGISAKIAQTIGAIMEYDLAYRFRLQDLFSETTKEKLANNPYKECNRLFKIYCKRERMAVVKVKFQKVFRILSLPLLIPSIREAFSKAIKRSEFKRLQWDDIDMYWCKIRSDDDYFYCGKTHNERMGDLELPKAVQIVV